MKFNLKKEIPVFLLFVAPFVFLAFMWEKLPQVVPTHFNGAGMPDDYSDKSSLIWLILLIMGISYVLFLVIPFVDPKGKIKQMGNKFHSIKLLVMVFLAVLSCFIVYSAYKPEFMQSNALMMLISGLIAFLGNYFKTIKPNYFVGIRTPWTLENEIVWKKTHEFAGKWWLIVGIVLLLLGFFLPSGKYFVVVVMGVLLLAVVCAWYSYKVFLDERKKMGV